MQAGGEPRKARLRRRDLAERLLEVRAGEGPQGVRVDDVVGLAPRAHGLGVVLQLQLLDGEVRLAQRAVALGALRVDLADRGQALQGRLDRDAARQRVVAGQVLDGKERRPA